VSVLVVLVIACLTSLAIALAMRHHGIDLDVYESGARSLNRGHFLYSIDFGVHRDPQLLFTYPPFGAVIFVPTLVLGHSAAIWSWNLFTLALLAWLVVQVTPRRLGREVLTGYVLVALGVLVWTMPVIDHLGFGQVNILLYALCCYDLVHPDSRRMPRPYRGILVGIATAVKLLPGLFIVYLFVIGRRADAARAAFAFGVCTLVTGIAFPTPSKDFWFHALLHTGRVGGNDYFSNQSLNGLFSRIGGPVAHWLMAVCVLGVAFLGIRWASHAYRRGNQIAGFLLIGMTINLVSPVSWIHHLIPLCLTLLYLGVLPGVSRRLQVFVGVAVALLLFRLPYLGDILVRGHPDGGWHLLGLPLRETYLVLTLVTAVVLARLTATGDSVESAAGDLDAVRTRVPPPRTVPAGPVAAAQAMTAPLSRVRRSPRSERPSSGETTPAGPG
jgi:alpha-1,2-mannosyltransferase